MKQTVPRLFSYVHGAVKCRMLGHMPAHQFQQLISHADHRKKGPTPSMGVLLGSPGPLSSPLTLGRGGPALGRLQHSIIHMMQT